MRGAFVGNFKFAKEPLRLGQLKGNHFTIALRNVTATDDEISAALTSLRDNGFVNYYGLQRFGTVATVPTQEIGKALLQGNWNEAIDLILKPRSGEFLDMAEAREIYSKTKDAKAALDKIQRQDKIEAKLLRGIVQCGKTNPQGALDALPRNARTMYIHAYQSFVWNHLVSRRIKELGNKPIVGDLVYEKRDTHDTTEAAHDESTEGGEDTEKELEKSEGNGKEADKKDQEESDKKDKDEADKKDQEEADGKDKEEADKKTPEEGDGKGTEKGVTQGEATDGKGEEAVVKDGETGESNEMEVVQDEVKPEVKKNKDEPIEKDFYPLPAVKMLTEEDLEHYTLSDVVMPQPGWRVTYPSYAKQWYEDFLAKDGLTTDLRQKNQ